jgi:hypothetical protein
MFVIPNPAQGKKVNKTPSQQDKLPCGGTSLPSQLLKRHKQKNCGPRPAWTKKWETPPEK